MESLYRKYRPATWGDVLGQDHIVSVLETAAKKGNIGHAYLFAGSRGIGKTSIARIFAKAIGTADVDISEMDAASNRGIDDVRELGDGVRVLPFESKYKVYIIDEAHMLTKEAWNAFLKTLEEPPKHAVFILATTEMDKIPDTIISRCEAHVFRKPSREIVRDLMMKTAKNEGYKIDSASAELIAILSGGSFRDAHGVLQKVISISPDKEVDPGEIARIVGAPPTELVNNFLVSVGRGDTEAGLTLVGEAKGMGIEMDVFLKLFLHKLRAALLFRYAPKMKESLVGDFTAEDVTFLEGIAKDKEMNINSETLVAFLNAEEGVKRASIPEAPIELALIKLGEKH